RIVVLNSGNVEQVGPPQQLYERPVSPFVAQFLGQINALPLHAAYGNGAMIANGREQYPNRQNNTTDVVYVRPHDFDVRDQPNGRPCWNARVERATPLGGFVRLELSLNDSSQVLVELASDYWERLNVSEADTVFLSPRVQTFVGPLGGQPFQSDEPAR